jgi:hypothetical protein
VFRKLDRGYSNRQCPDSSVTRRPQVTLSTSTTTRVLFLVVNGHVTALWIVQRVVDQHCFVSRAVVIFFLVPKIVHVLHAQTVQCSGSSGRPCPFRTPDFFLPCWFSDLRGLHWRPYHRDASHSAAHLEYMYFRFSSYSVLVFNYAYMFLDRSF